MRMSQTTRRHAVLVGLAAFLMLPGMPVTVTPCGATGVPWEGGRDDRRPRGPGPTGESLVKAESEAERWRREQIETLSRRLRDAAPDDRRRDEWEARLGWLRRWQPGSMPAAADVPGPASELVDEPDLAALDVGGASAAEEFGRAVRLQRQLRERDTLENRKRELEPIAELASRLDRSLTRLLRMLDIDPAEFSRAEPSAAGTLPDSLRWALAHARYRRARAIAYRELPDVVSVTPIADRESFEAELGRAQRRLRACFPGPRPEFVLFDIRMLRRDDRRGQALDRLERFAWAIDPKWYLKKRRDLLQELGWEPPYREAATRYAESGLDPEAGLDPEEGEGPDES